MVQEKRLRGKINSEKEQETENKGIGRETTWTQGTASVEKPLAV